MYSYMYLALCIVYLCIVYLCIFWKDESAQDRLLGTATHALETWITRVGVHSICVTSFSRKR